MPAGLRVFDFKYDRFQFVPPELSGNGVDRPERFGGACHDPHLCKAPEMPLLAGFSGVRGIGAAKAGMGGWDGKSHCDVPKLRLASSASWAPRATRLLDVGLDFCCERSVAGETGGAVAAP